MTQKINELAERCGSWCAWRSIWYFEFALNLTEGEDEILVQQIAASRNSSKIYDFVERTDFALYADEDSALARLHRVLTQGHDIARNDQELQDKLDHKPESQICKITRAEIEYKNVNFSYTDGLSVFDSLSVKIKSGERVGLVGYSGSGKTTFVNLLLRMYDLQGGQILVDGQDIAKCTQNSLRSQVAMIPQEPMLFHRSLMENIRYGKEDATDDEVMMASKLAKAHDFIERLPESYKSLVGERGVKLSGGQRQRIAIARAILKNARVLVMDEATSSLDSVTEKSIQTALKDLMEDKTVLVIAHRLSTISHLNRIIVFDKGKVVRMELMMSFLLKKVTMRVYGVCKSADFYPVAKTQSKET